MAYVITDVCTKDLECVKVCPVDCIHPKDDESDFASAKQLFIDPETCIDCGACQPVCPVQAIHPVDELPQDLARFAQVNADYYAKRG
jgi:NAD-dependent dihydropyrimidine dehydrogenase PreA subunit